MPAIKVFVRGFADRVVATGKRRSFVVELVALEFGDNLPGKFRQERQIVSRINDQRFSREAGEVFEVRDWADGRPQPAQSFQIDMRFEALTDMSR